MAVNATPQTSLYETTIEDPTLEALLEKRESAREKRAKANGDFKTLDVEAKKLIDALDVADGGVRVGRFVIKVSEIEGKLVSFETAPSTRTTIAPLGELA